MADTESEQSIDESSPIGLSEPTSASQPEPFSAPPYKPGDPISGAMTLDGLISTVYSLSPTLGAYTLDWSDATTVIATFPNAESEDAQSTAFIKIRLQTRAYPPDYIQQIVPQ